MNESDTDANTKAIDSLLNFETVKYFGAEKREAARYDTSMARYERLSVRTYVSLAVLNAGQAIIFTIGMVVVLVMCVVGIRAGRNTVGDFVLLNADDAAALPAAQLHGHGLSRHQAGDRRHRDDVRHPRRRIRRSRTGRARAPLVVSRGAVRFENVDFAYDPARQILRGVSFEAPAGRTVAIVGPSGAGKSTISRLLFRFYEPSAGRITIDGQDIADVTQASLRAAIGMVPQDTVLFNDTILYNIRYGRDDATDEEVRGGRARRADRRLHPLAAAGLRRAGRRARPETVGRREAARRDRPHHAEGAADPGARRGDVGARQLHRARNPGGAGAGLQGAHDADHRAPALDGRPRRRNPGARQGRDRRARHARGAARAGRPLRRRCGAVSARSTPRRRRCGAPTDAPTRRPTRARSADDAPLDAGAERATAGRQGLAARDFCARLAPKDRRSPRAPVMSVLDSIRRQLTPDPSRRATSSSPRFVVATLILGWMWAPLGWIGADRDAVVRLFLPRSRRA